LPRFRLILLIHSHQPVGNFESVFESAYQQAYLPFLQVLSKHPAVRVGMHYTGPLLEWFEAHHPEYFDLLRELGEKGQVEMVGGGFYEPILVAIPYEDRLEQIRRLAEFIEKKFGRRPQGAWLAERVWEPQLPSTLAAAGVGYTLVDDIHFLAAGFELDQLYGYYLAEDLGATVKLIPGLKSLRYLMPFGTVEDTIAFLKKSAQAHPGGFAALGDDCEKFGVWPETHKHCYEDGWLERMFTAIEANDDWLETATPGDCLDTLAPLGRADLPTAAYTEMTEWALPTPARKRFQALQREFSARPDAQAFLRGSHWRSFLTKYPEANLLHKRMLYASSKIRRVSSAVRRGLPLRRVLDRAATHLFRGQCNDAYWHGVFGGLYSPHLRSSVLRDLIVAEKLADAAEQGSAAYVESHLLDFDADGYEEIYLVSESYSALVKPSDGGTVAALDFRVSDVPLINSLQRRPEAYHDRVREASAAAGARGPGVASIHDRLQVKEAGLERWLVYDRWPRHAFRLLLFPSGKTWDDYAQVFLEESPNFAGADYTVASSAAERLELVCDAPLIPPRGSQPDGPLVHAAKSFLFSRNAKGFELACHLAISSQSAEPLRLMAGLELVFNLLAPDAPDRYFEWSGSRQPLRWGGTAAAPELRMVDEWQNVSILINAPNAREFWVAPIETVSESEDGFERVYQGSQILPLWPLELMPGALWTGRVSVRVGLAGGERTA
jgi:4-alpha-glucanotransferase